MPYATVDAIRAEFPGSVIPVSSSDGSKVDEADVEGWLAEESAKIDAAIASRYELPIVGTASLLVLKSICIALVAWRYAKATDMKNEQALPSVGQPYAIVPQTPNVSQAKKSAEDTLRALLNGTMNLVDAVQKVGISSYLVDVDDTPKFQVDRQQW